MLDAIKITDIATVFTSIVAAIIAWQAWNAQKSNNLIYLNEMIENAKNQYTELMRLKVTNNIQNSEGYKDLFSVTIENLLNAYDSAAAFYLCGWWFFSVVNKDVFKRARAKEIIKLVENTEIKKVIPDIRESHKNLWEAYAIFINQEKHTIR